MSTTPIKGKDSTAQPGPWAEGEAGSGGSRTIWGRSGRKARGRLIAILPRHFHDGSSRPDPQDDADFELALAAPETAAERDRLRALNADLLAALPDPTKLDLLAVWLDLDDVAMRRSVTGEPLVQDDLRDWARRARAAIAQTEEAS